MFAQQRRRQIQAAGSLSELDGQAGLLDRAQSGMGHFPQHFPVQHLGIAEHIGQVVNRAGRHIKPLQVGDPVLGRPGQKVLLQQGNQGSPVFHPDAVIGELRPVLQIRPLNGLAEPFPQPFRADGHIQIFAVLPHKSLVRHQGGMGRAQPLRRAVVGKIVAGLIGQPGHLRVQHRDVNVLALAAGLIPVVEGGHNGKGGPHSGADVGNGHAHLLRLAAGFAGNAHQAADALHNLIVSRAALVRPVLPEAGNGAVDDARIDDLDGGVAEAEAGHYAGSKVFHDDIGLGGQLQENIPGLVLLEVEGQAALVAVDGQEVGAFRADKGRPPVAGIVAAARQFNLEDVGAIVAQHQGTERAGQGPGQIQHAHPLQRFHSRHPS